MEDAALLVAVTSEEAVNITTCLIAKKLGAKSTIARINKMEYLIDKESLDLKDIGIDNLISPESLAAREIKYILKSPALTEMIDLENGKLSIMSLSLHEESPLIGKSIGQMTHLIPEQSFMIVAIQRFEETIIPSGSTIFNEGDQIYFLSKPKDKNKVLEFVGKEPITIKRLMIIGGSRTGKYLSKTYEITLIEKDPDKVQELAMEVQGVQIVHGNGADAKMLQQEKIETYDALVAVTGSSETNISSCLIAKDMGVKKTVALVENPSLFNYSKKLGVDTFVNKKFAAANFVFRSFHQSEIFSKLYGIKAEILEFVVKENSKITKKPISKLSIPSNTVISGVIRQNSGFITQGDFQIQAGDKVLIFTLPKNVQKVTTLFS